ncbi:hypothetical protein F4824DRAFT_506775 [Ustulina deusta]|nr:hypothetical protein F4824DRAFT_506775 [Ustulina deusta]
MWLDQEALFNTAPNDAARPGLLYALEKALLALYRRTPEWSVLENAIQNFVAARVIMPPTHPLRPTILHDLGMAYRLRYRRTMAVGNLTNSIHEFHAAVNITQPDDPSVSRFGIAITILQDSLRIPFQTDENFIERFHNLSSFCFERFRMTQSDGDFNLAMQYLEDAFSRTNSNDPDYVDQIHHFGVLYHDRFRSTGATADMTGALGSALNDRYERLGTTNDLELLIPLLQESIEDAPADDPYLTHHVYNLTVGHIMQKFRIAKSTRNLNIVITHLKKVVEMTKSGDTALPKRLHTLSAAYLDRFRHQWELRTLTSNGKGPYLTVTRTAGSGFCLFLKYENQGQSSDLENPIELYLEARAHLPSPAKDRFSGRNLLHVYALKREWARAYHAALQVETLILR